MYIFQKQTNKQKLTHAGQFVHSLDCNSSIMHYKKDSLRAPLPGNAHWVAELFTLHILESAFQSKIDKCLSVLELQNNSEQEKSLC